MRVLPPELLRTLPERRALIIRANLSPVVVRLRMAWHRHDNRRARHRILAPLRSLQIPAARPQLPPLPPSDAPDDQTWPSAGPAPHPEHGAPDPQPPRHDTLTQPCLDLRPLTRPAWTPPRDLPPRPPAEPRVPRPRRPWEPPTDSGNRR
jgi:hypothetical protein